MTISGKKSERNISLGSELTLLQLGSEKLIIESQS